MSVTYQFVPDSRYYRQVIDRYYRQRPFALWLPVQFTLILVPIIMLWLYGLIEGADWTRVIGLLLPFLALGAFFAVQLTRWLTIQRFKGKGDFGKEAVVTLSDEGVFASGMHAQGKWEWIAYPRSVRFADGLLLMRPGVIRWLPDSALRTGTVEEAMSLVTAKTVLRHLS